MNEVWSNIKFYGRCIKIVFREWWHRLFPVVAFCVCCGCVNCYTRWPTTDERIDRVYQCSREAAALSVIVSFPQAMSDGPSRGFMWENLLTIPFLGLPCAVDAVCEACIDTVCLPVDWPLAASRKGGK